MVEMSLESIMRTLFHHVQSCIRSVIYNVFEQIILGLLCKEVIGETLEARREKLLDTDASADRFSKRLLTSGSYMKPTVTFMRREMDNTWKIRNKAQRSREMNRKMP